MMTLQQQESCTGYYWVVTQVVPPEVWTVAPSGDTGEGVVPGRASSPVGWQHKSSCVTTGGEPDGSVSARVWGLPLGVAAFTKPPLLQRNRGGLVNGWQPSGLGPVVFACYAPGQKFSSKVVLMEYGIVFRKIQFVQQRDLWFTFNAWSQRLLFGPNFQSLCPSLDGKGSFMTIQLVCLVHWL